jgi:hypothetical protein
VSRIWVARTHIIPVVVRAEGAGSGKVDIARLSPEWLVDRKTRRKVGTAGHQTAVLGRAGRGIYSAGRAGCAIAARFHGYEGRHGSSIFWLRLSDRKAPEIQAGLRFCNIPEHKVSGRRDRAVLLREVASPWQDSHRRRAIGARSPSAAGTLSILTGDHDETARPRAKSSTQFAGLGDRDQESLASARFDRRVIRLALARAGQGSTWPNRQHCRVRVG